jgi:hypothetical protein
MNKKIVRKILIQNNFRGLTAKVEIFVNSMSKEAAINTVKKIYGNNYKLIQILI